MNAVPVDRDPIASAARNERTAGRLIVVAGGVLTGLIGFMVTGSPIVAMTALPAGAIASAAAVGWSNRRATASAACDAWAADLGWAPTDALVAPLPMPLVLFDDECRVDQGYQGRVEACPAVLARVSSIRRRVRDNQDGTFSESHSEHPFTIIEVATLRQDATRFSLRPRRRVGLLDDIETAAGPDRLVELESAELGDRYRLLVDATESEMEARRLFTPALIVDLVDQAPDGAIIDFEGGTLVIAVPGHRFDPMLNERFRKTAVALVSRLSLGGCS
jgi:hypothetical protein